MDSREIIKRLESDGWFKVKTVGDHWQFKHPLKKGKVTVTHPKKDLATWLIKSIEKQSGLKLR
jgi:predicted RNA binding protein YcfA (HicA-like mRNA interferase family)